MYFSTYTLIFNFQSLLLFLSSLHILSPIHFLPVPSFPSLPPFVIFSKIPTCTLPNIFHLFLYISRNPILSTPSQWLMWLMENRRAVRVYNKAWCYHFFWGCSWTTAATKTSQYLTAVWKVESICSLEVSHFAVLVLFMGLGGFKDWITPW